MNWAFFFQLLPGALLFLGTVFVIVTIVVLKFKEEQK